MDIDIGSRLKEARESKSMTLEQVQDITKIQKRYLQAIENNEFKVLPGKFYTRAFIREYASAVGLDPEVIMEEHRSEIPEFEDESIVNYSRVQKSRNESSGKSSGLSRMFPTIITVVLIIFLLFVAYIFITQMNDGSKDNQPASSNENEVSVPESKDQGKDKSETDGSSDSANKEDGSSKDSGSSNSDGEKANQDKQDENKKEEQSKPEVKLTQKGTGSFPEHTFNVTGADQPSLTIDITGKTYLEVSAPKGGENLTPPKNYTQADSPIKIDVKDRKQVYVKIGSAPSVEVKINGQKVNYPVDAKQLVTQKFLLNFK